jgi:hypothetical protein
MEMPFRTGRIISKRFWRCQQTVFPRRTEKPPLVSCPTEGIPVEQEKAARRVDPIAAGVIGNPEMRGKDAPFHSGTFFVNNP